MDKPVTRVESYLSAIAGEDTRVPAEPITRIEKYLQAILDNGGGGGGGGNKMNRVSDPVEGDILYTNANGQAVDGGINIDDVALVDGVYEGMTVGNAEQLVSKVFTEEKVPYLFRTSGGSVDISNREEDTIVGGTVVWNQLMQNALLDAYNANGITISYADGVYTLSGQATQDISIRLAYIDNLINGHVYFRGYRFGSGSTFYLLGRGDGIRRSYYSQIGRATADAEIGSMTFSVLNGADVNGVKFTLNAFDLTQMFGSTIADYIYTLEQANAGAGVAWFKKLFPKDYYEYNPGELLSVEGLESHDMVGFNAYDEETEEAKLLGGYQYEITGTYTSVSYVDINGDSETLAITDGKFTPTNNGTLTVVGGNNVCVHLVWGGSRNGEYEEFKKYSYPLDSSLTLRGIPKLDENNNLYYDGDTYESDGTVTRKYGIVDLGTLNWWYNGTEQAFYSERINKKAGLFNVFCSKYVTRTSGQTNWNLNDKEVGGGSNSDLLYIKDLSYVDRQEFKGSLDGVYAIYELAEPTTEQAEPFTNPQIVDDFGTEEYVTTSIVPVGHITKYPSNLRDKLQHLPDLASGDGDYIVRQSNSSMSLVPLLEVKELPDTPSADGNYVLKCAVADGVATLSWEAE